ncbi:hypothetical protein BJ508DRAFT_324191 [Ascobolus immersus RN42]|uniref:Uncharacterized protein n=1 Tax=Ascobolus immersus RN42 TaxID=1160509 RepID=A0A3N4IEF4_ASCIM|nr:hypothetical protein BJ508DRAFT_324191 [Ascobolus immersus RN42]
MPKFTFESLLLFLPNRDQLSLLSANRMATSSPHIKPRSNPNSKNNLKKELMLVAVLAPALLVAWAVILCLYIRHRKKRRELGLLEDDLDDGSAMNTEKKGTR